MNDYHCILTFNAPSQKVYEAVTTQKGIQNWWTKDCNVDTRLGGKATMRFGKTYNVMQFEKLTSTQVQWRCVEQHHAAELLLNKADEWVGTHVVFLIKHWITTRQSCISRTKV